MIEKKLDQIEKADIDALRTNAVPETKTLDYKEILHGKKDDEKKELLADVSSFANAAGGDLIFGVVEDGGVPVDILGVAGIDADKEILRIEQTIQAGVAPRIPGVQMKAIHGFPNGPVLVLRVPSSWASPHMVTFNNTSRFYTRSSAGKYQMDVSELRSAFVLSEGLPERIRTFRDDRLGKIMAGETPVLLEPRPVLVVHLLPISSFTSGTSLNLADLKDGNLRFSPINSGGFDTRYNLDGVVSFSGPRGNKARSPDYCQVFRSGRVESVYAGILHERDGTAWIAGGAYESWIVQAISGYLMNLGELEVPPPLVCLVSMLQVKGAQMATRGYWAFSQCNPIDRDMLVLPDVLFNGYDEEPPSVLRPVFNAIWNACGYARSQNYDDAGNWVPR